LKGSRRVTGRLGSGLKEVVVSSREVVTRCASRQTNIEGEKKTDRSIARPKESREERDLDR
jgi:hypothetical protein